MSWDKELQELALRKELAARMGGEAKVRRHREGGKLPVRERITGMVDKGSFREVGALTGSGEYDAEGRLTDLTPSNLLIGRAKVEGRPVVVAADDFTVRGGANDGAVGDKLVEAERMAHDLRLPLLRLVDGTGGGGSVRNIEIKGH
ncbi:MAG: carboxyl transferase domain-containing protein, partial [Alcaligenes sp.]